MNSNALLISLASLFLLAPVVNASDVNIEWDPSSGATGYTVFYGLQSGVYTEQLNVGSLIRTPIAGLAPSTTYYFTVMAHNGFGSSAASTQLEATTGAAGLDVGSTDFNLDGHADLLWQHTDGSLAAWLMQGSSMTSYQFLSPRGLTDVSWRVVGVGDFDGDGRPDLLWRHAVNGGLAAVLMNGMTMISATLLSPSVVADKQWKIVGVADFNTDGSPDLVWEHQTTGELVTWLMNGTAVASVVGLVPSASADLNWTVVAAVDLNHDGQPDLLWRNKATGGLRVWFMSGTSMASSAPLSPSTVADLRWKVVAVAHLNADADHDLLWQNQTTGDLVVWFMNGTTVASGQAVVPSRAGDLGWKVVAAR